MTMYATRQLRVQLIEITKIEDHKWDNSKDIVINPGPPTIKEMNSLYGLMWR